MYIRMCTHIYAHIYVYIYMYISMYIYVLVYIYLQVSVLFVGVSRTRIRSASCKADRAIIIEYEAYTYPSRLSEAMHEVWRQDCSKCGFDSARRGAYYSCYCFTYSLKSFAVKVPYNVSAACDMPAPRSVAGPSSWTRPREPEDLICHLRNQWLA